ncbi:MAG TPA: hypothetical protein VGL53_27705 [Bryobacteraceae bacterium]|jgi:hypothetical protein
MKLCAIVLLAAATHLTAAELPKAETLLDHYVEVTGGRAAYEKRTTEYMSGSIELPASGVKGKVEMWGATPDSRVEMMDIEGVGRIETGTDGKIGWENSAIMGPRLQEGAELRFHLRDATFNEPLHWREMYKKEETVGVENVDGVPCYKVIMTPMEGKPETWYFDQKTDLVLKMLRTSVTSMGEVNGEYLMKDYKDSDGVLMPTMMIQKAAGQEIRVKFTTITPNAKIPPDRFVPPAEVKQLMTPAPKKGS